MLNAKGIYNCPNCGAPITSEQCPYCGTVFYDFTSLELGKPSYIKIRHNGQIVMCKAFMTKCDISVHPNYVTYDRLGEITPRRLAISNKAEINMHFEVISEGGMLFTAVKEEK